MAGFYDRYPKGDANGNANERVELRRVSNGAISIGIDDGYDVVENEVIPHVALAQLVRMLTKKQPDPKTGELVPVFVLAKPHTFKQRGSARHPLAGFSTVFSDAHEKVKANFDEEKKLRAVKVKENTDQILAEAKVKAKKAE